MTEISKVTIGCDLGDKTSQVCVLDERGDIVEEARVRTTAPGMARLAKSWPGARLAIEAGSHSAWVAEFFETRGHQVLVANPRAVPLITRNQRKSDRCDAETLARLARSDPKLLSPIRHPARAARIDLATLRARDLLVRTRTRLITHTRAIVKGLGERLPSSSSEAFVRRVREAQLPAELQPALDPILDVIERLDERIARYDERVEQMAATSYPQTARLAQVRGVGVLTALTFVLAVQDPHRFRSGRDVAAFFGLVPRRGQSGDSDPECRITKAGNGYVRQLLVQCAHYVLGPLGSDSDLRRWGLELAGRGRKNAKKRAVVATARKLAVLLFALWKSGQAYQPTRHASPQGNAA